MGYSGFLFGFAGSLGLFLGYPGSLFECMVADINQTMLFQTFIRQFFTAKHPEIAAKFDEKEKEEGLVRPDQVASFKMQSFSFFSLN